MIVGLPRERKPQEFRVALPPVAAARLVDRGHAVLVEAGAGAGAGFPDAAYRDAGAAVTAGPGEVWRRADLVLKVKAPLPEEFGRFQPEQILFCYLHTEMRRDLTTALLERRIAALAFENVRSATGGRPLLEPMSRIAGQQAVLQGMQFLLNHRGGIGISLAAVPGVPPALVIVLGAGHAGLAAARTAAAIGARVEIFEIDRARIEALEAKLPDNIRVRPSDPEAIAGRIAAADLVIHATTLPPGSDIKLIRRNDLKRMRRGSVIVDVTAHPAGAIETADRHTSHENPVYEVEGVLHYAVPNIPGSVAHSASLALAEAVRPHVEALADRGLRNALRADPGLFAALACMDGVLTRQETGEALGLPWIPAATLAEF